MSNIYVPILITRKVKIFNVCSLFAYVYPLMFIKDRIKSKIAAIWHYQAIGQLSIAANHSPDKPLSNIVLDKA